MTEGDRLSRIEHLLDRLVEESTRTRVELGQVQATLAAHVERQTERTAARDRRCEDHDRRIREVAGHEHGDLAAVVRDVSDIQRWRWLITGAVATAGGSVGAGLAAVFNGK